MRPMRVTDFSRGHCARMVSPSKCTSRADSPRFGFMAGIASHSAGFGLLDSYPPPNYTRDVSNPLSLQNALRERYLIEALIGQGGMGAVYRVADLRLPGRTCALKVMH